jgi:predicted membrane-bound spermidine synthase
MENEESPQKMPTAKNILLKITVFVCGAAVMILELLGVRVLSPYFGNSFYVWTSIIGVILAALSFGYWLGGYIADKKQATFKKLSLIIFLAGVFIGGTGFLKEIVLVFFRDSIADIQIGTILGALVLLGAPSIFLAMVSPYAVKIKLKSLVVTGRTTGSLYAFSTIGSIFGTFLTGFWLLPHFGNTRLLFWLAIVLLINSALLYFNALKKTKFFLIVLFLIGIVAYNFSEAEMEKNYFVDRDTRNSRIWIYRIFVSDYSDSRLRPLLVMSDGRNTIQSVAFLDDPNELFSKILKFFRLADYFNPDIKRALMIGGGAYSFIPDFLSRNPEATLEVAEIDPEITALAKKYFGLKNNPRLKIYHFDGRIFLEKNKERYDAVFIDAFSGSAPPFHLTTREFVQVLYDSMNENGVVSINVPSPIVGERSKMLRAQYKVYKTVFPQVYLFPTNPAFPEIFQNINLVAIKSDQPQSLTSENPEFSTCLKNFWRENIADDIPLLSDDFAPIEAYAALAAKREETFSFLTYKDLYPLSLKNLLLPSGNETERRLY